ncbi:fimbria/pilus outer membrane usher protein [Caballeronia sp. AZ10_KS36]|uniref:fimbria/pilus outer membrane usher protein n=1 Tax=Caballeronia sp. AZ10_KS36 TaxID=2921757 RepID=UPI0020291BC2|nr:fimbria/pilus outer membrane usher protein [Caballeronia sp. AZ10_KS36]
MPALAASATLAFAVHAAWAAPTPSALSAASAADARADGVLYLEVIVNGISTEQIAQFFMSGSAIYARPAELAEVGILAGRAPVDARGRVALNAIAGLTYDYHPDAQRLELHVSDAQRVPSMLGDQTLRRPLTATGTGALINYEFTVQPQDGARYALFSEERFFHSGGTISNTGTAYRYGSSTGYTRLDTSWRHSDPTTLVTTRVGDTISSSLSWTRAVRLGGVQISRDFALRPDLVTYPVPSLNGSAAVPTAVDLYVNNVRQYSGSAPSGPFVINAVPAVTGAGEATIVTRDALGRNVMTTVPLYIDSRLLAPGLTDFSLEAGFIRRSYGADSLGYGEPSLSGSLRRGIVPMLTLEAHIEATRGLINLGLGGLIRAGAAGVVNVSAAASTGRVATPAPTSTQSTTSGTGAQMDIGWQYRAPSLSIDLQAQRASSRFGDLASSEGTPVSKSSERATIAMPFRAAGVPCSVSATYVGVDDPYSGRSRIGSLALSSTIAGRVAASASLYHDFGSTHKLGLFVALSMPIGGTMNASVSGGFDQHSPMLNASLSRTSNFDGGLGWQVQGGTQDSNAVGLAQANYRSRYGDVIGSVYENRGHASTELDGSGSIVLMAGDVLAGRRIDEAFAVVDTNGVPNVPVLHENRLIGTTNSAGHLLVPNLLAYDSNHLSIDPMRLPATTSISSTSLNVSPQARAGVLAKFRIESFTGAQLKLIDERGQPLVPGARATVSETGKQYIVGYDGLTFIDDLQPQNHLLAQWSTVDGDRTCELDVTYAPSTEHALDTLGPFVCKRMTR